VMEAQFRRALQVSQGDPAIFFTRPLSLAILLLALVPLVLPYLPALLSGSEASGLSKVALSSARAKKTRAFARAASLPANNPSYDSEPRYSDEQRSQRQKWTGRRPSTRLGHPLHLCRDGSRGGCRSGGCRGTEERARLQY
jgi:hypothetical protein